MLLYLILCFEIIKNSSASVPYNEKGLYFELDIYEHLDPECISELKSIKIKYQDGDNIYTIIGNLFLLNKDIIQDKLCLFFSIDRKFELKSILEIEYIFKKYNIILKRTIHMKEISENDVCLLPVSENKVIALVCGELFVFMVDFYRPIITLEVLILISQTVEPMDSTDELFLNFIRDASYSKLTFLNLLIWQSYNFQLRDQSSSHEGVKSCDHMILFDYLLKRMIFFSNLLHDMLQSHKETPLTRFEIMESNFLFSMLFKEIKISEVAYIYSSFQDIEYNFAFLNNRKEIVEQEIEGISKFGFPHIYFYSTLRESNIHFIRYRNENQPYGYCLNIYHEL